MFGRQVFRYRDHAKKLDEFKQVHPKWHHRNFSLWRVLLALLIVAISIVIVVTSYQDKTSIAIALVLFFSALAYMLNAQIIAVVYYDDKVLFINNEEVRLKSIYEVKGAGNPMIGLISLYNQTQIKIPRSAMAFIYGLKAESK